MGLDLAELKRELDWHLQNALRLSAPVFKRTVGDLESAAELLDEEGAARLAELRGRYPLDPWPTLCSEGEFLHSLYLLDLLDRRLGKPDPGRGLDIGCGPWAYLPALAAWSGGPWDGVEIDAHRRHVTGVTRAGYGRWMARRHPRCRYLAQSLLDVQGRYRTITWLLPLVTEGRLAAHRLPRRLFQPLELLRHAWGLLEPGGRLLIVNQEPEERLAQQRLLHAAEIPAVDLGELTSPILTYRHPRFGWLAVKGFE